MRWTLLLLLGAMVWLTSLGGLGRYLIDGIKVREFYIALVGALMVTALALIGAVAAPAL